MLNRKDEFFVQLPSEQVGRILHRASIIELLGKDQYIGMLSEGDSLILDPDQEIRVYYEVKREFMQQIGRVTLRTNLEDVEGFAFETIGDPVSAEDRQCYRVSTISAKLKAALGNEPSCDLTDVSVTGFSVLSPEQLNKGSIVPATLNHNGQEFTGSVCVQSIADLHDGRTRYGLYCADNSRSAGTLIKGTQQISMDVQRRQLKRRAGA